MSIATQILLTLGVGNVIISLFVREQAIFVIGLCFVMLGWVTNLGAGGSNEEY